MIFICQADVMITNVRVCLRHQSHPFDTLNSVGFPRNVQARYTGDKVTSKDSKALRAG